MTNYKGFYKVARNGFGVESCTFFNPETGESFTKIVWDIDNDELLYDNVLQILRFLPIDNDVRKIWLKKNGVISVGDTVEVFKGRKVKIGTVAVVTDIKPWRDSFGRIQTTYAYLSTGERTNIANCKLV